MSRHFYAPLLVRLNGGVDRTSVDSEQSSRFGSSCPFIGFYYFGLAPSWNLFVIRGYAVRVFVKVGVIEISYRSTIVVDKGNGFSVGDGNVCDI